MPQVNQVTDEKVLATTSGAAGGGEGERMKKLSPSTSFWTVDKVASDASLLSEPEDAVGMRWDRSAAGASLQQPSDGQPPWSLSWRGEAPMGRNCHSA